MSYNNEDTDALVNKVFDKTNLNLIPDDIEPAIENRSVLQSTTASVFWSNAPVVRSINVIAYAVSGEMSGSILNVTRPITLVFERISNQVFIYINEEVFNLGEFDTSGNVIIETDIGFDPDYNPRETNINIGEYMFNNSGDSSIGYLNPRCSVTAPAGRLRITSDEMTGVVNSNPNNTFSLRRAPIFYPAAIV